MKILIFAAILAASSTIGCAQFPAMDKFVRSRSDAISCKEPPRRGEIQVLYDKYGKIEGCGYWKASNALAARIILRDFDSFESHAPEVIYKSYGNYPIYTQKVIGGGCGHGELNCMD